MPTYLFVFVLALPLNGRSYGHQLAWPQTLQMLQLAHLRPESPFPESSRDLWRCHDLWRCRDLGHSDQLHGKSYFLFLLLFYHDYHLACDDMKVMFQVYWHREKRLTDLVSGLLLRLLPDVLH